MFIALYNEIIYLIHKGTSSFMWNWNQILSWFRRNFPDKQKCTDLTPVFKKDDPARAKELKISKRSTTTLKKYFND